MLQDHGQLVYNNLEDIKDNSEWELVMSTRDKIILSGKEYKKVLEILRSNNPIKYLTVGKFQTISLSHIVGIFIVHTGTADEDKRINTSQMNVIPELTDEQKANIEKQKEILREKMNWSKK